MLPLIAAAAAAGSLLMQRLMAHEGLQPQEEPPPSTLPGTSASTTHSTTHSTAEYSTAADTTWHHPGLGPEFGGPATGVSVHDSEGGTRFYGTVLPHLAKGVAQGSIGLVSDAGKGWAMIGDTLITGGRHIDRLAGFELRPWAYEPGLGQAAGLAGEMLSPAAAARALQAGAAGARMAVPLLADEAHHFLARQGLLLHVVERGPAAQGTRLFDNQLPHRLAQELAEARALGVTPIRVGDAGFEKLVNEGTIKFVVTESGDLLVGPHSVHGVEISHAVLSNGKAVRVAGEAEVMGHRGLYVATEIEPHSGHFMNGSSHAQNAASKALAQAAFQRAGVQVME